MDALKELLNNLEKVQVLKDLPSDEVCLGIVLNSYLSGPTVEGARFLLKHFNDVSENCKGKVALVLLEILIKILSETNKVEEVASLFECSAFVMVKLNQQVLNEKMTFLFDALLERVSIEMGLYLIKWFKEYGLDHYVNRLEESTLASLDLSVSNKKGTFEALVKVAEICKDKKKLTVLNSLAFHSIEYYLLYQIEDLRGYNKPLEDFLMKYLDIWTYCQRLKLAEIYKRKMEESIKIDGKLIINEDLINSLKSPKFTDPHLLKKEFQEFTYLVEDILQFNLPKHVILQKIKNLHGRYKDFSKSLIKALQAVNEDGPGFEVMEKISSVIKPMKLLSKNEFLHYKRNEKRINYQEPEVQIELKIPEIFAFSQENGEKFLGSLDLKPVTSDDREKVEKIIENISQRFQNSRLSLVGSFALGTWSKSGNIDVTIMSETSEKSLFLSSIKYKLLPLGSVELIPSKTNPILKYKQKDSDFFINISVNNQKAVDFVREFQPLLSEQVKKLIITVKAFAEAQKWKDVKKGFFSGYDWTFLCISFIQNPQINNEFQGNSNEKNFYKFLHFVFNALGKKVDLKKGILDEKTDSLIGIVDFFTGKENDSRAKLARKQGKEFKKRLAAVLNELSYS